MIFSDYCSLLKQLYSINLSRHEKSGLRGMQQLSALFGFPEKRFKTIHVTGSNGKGSVTTKIAKALELSGKKVGLYTSPHISSFRERIQINGELISEKQVTSLLSDIFFALKMNGIQASFFEITTLLAFRYFAEQNVDVAVIEVGIGGRLDSTNIITPLLSAITSISLEHTNILGKTLAEIAREKAGIIKPFVPVVLGPHVPLDLILPFAEKLNSTCIQIEGNFETFDAENSATAKRCLEILKVPTQAITEGCKALPPCRIETISMPQNLHENGSKGREALTPKAIILDVAHNPNGIENLFAALKHRFPIEKFRIVCGLSADKETEECVRILRQYGQAFHLLEAKNMRALPSNLLYQEFTKQGTRPEDLFLKNSLEANLDLAVKRASAADEVLVICGTFFIMAPIRAYFAIIEPCDPFELNKVPIHSMR